MLDSVVTAPAPIEGGDGSQRELFEGVVRLVKAGVGAAAKRERKTVYVLRRYFLPSLLRGLLAAGCVVGAGSLSAAPGVIAVASAHDAVLHSTPEDGSTVAQFPRRITLEFSGIPKDNFNTIAVTRADTGEALFSATPERDKQFMSVTVPEDVHPGPGEYVVGFQITSSDGHATRGKTTFTVAENPQDAPTEAATPPEETPADDSGVSLGFIVGLIAVVAVCGGVIATTKKRK